MKHWVIEFGGLVSALLLEKLEQLEAFGHHQKADPQYYPRPLGPACQEVPKMVCFNPRILLLLLATSLLSSVQTSVQSTEGFSRPRKSWSKLAYWFSQDCQPCSGFTAGLVLPVAAVHPLVVDGWVHQYLLPFTVSQAVLLQLEVLGPHSLFFCRF